MDATEIRATSGDVLDHILILREVVFAALKRIKVDKSLGLIKSILGHCGRRGKKLQRPL